MKAISLMKYEYLKLIYNVLVMVHEDLERRGCSPIVSSNKSLKDPKEIKEEPPKEEVKPPTPP